MPGSNPLFGLNTLGGALSVQTKDGATHPGTSAQVTAGAHGRAQLEVESGGKNERGLSWFGAASVFRDSGWRDDSPSRLGQAFAKLGWRSGATHLSLTASAASTALHGNGLQDGQLLAERYASVYTRPDETRNRSGLVSLAATHERDDGWTVSGQAYLRRIDTRTVNGDLNDDSLDQPLYALSGADRAALAGAGIAAPAVVDRDDDAVPVPALRRPGAAGRGHRARLQRRPPSQPQHAVAGRRVGAGDAQAADGRRRRIRSSSVPPSTPAGRASRRRRRRRSCYPIAASRR